MSHTIVHRALLDYLELAPPARRAEVIESIREKVVEMYVPMAGSAETNEHCRLHTKEGARIGMLCLIHGDAKDRKVMLKSFKPYVAKASSPHVIWLQSHDHRSVWRSTDTWCC